jgi:uncharacterized protein YlxP (DUF503 family)
MPMQIAVLTVTLYAPFVHTLKEKRAVVKSLLAKLSKFNVSVTESACQDVHQTVVITIASIAFNTAQADSVMDTILNFIDSNTEAQVTDVYREVR